MKTSIITKRINSLFFVLTCFVFTIISCKSKIIEIQEAGITNYREYESTFKDLKKLLEMEDGAFWGKELYGPILFVDPISREIIANENNNNQFQKSNSIFLGTLPTQYNIANTAFNWNGKRWTMVMLPLPGDRYERNKLIIHELFHRIQPQLQLGNFNEVGNNHLDTYDGRILLLLELNAIKKALGSETEISRLKHIHNALIFRNVRQKNEMIQKEENSLEMNEGLAEYTGLMLSGENEKKITSQLINSIEEFSTTSTFVRSFAYQTIPAYGFLLSRQNPQWHKNITAETILTDLLMEAFSANIPPGVTMERGLRGDNYSYNEILKTEKIREDKRLEKIAQLKKLFIEDPTLEIKFEQMNISFDPRNITPLDGLGTVYPNIRVSDNWGVLTVEQGALLSSDWSKIIVTAPVEIGESVVKGKGWILELENNWIVTRTNGNYQLQKSE